MRITDTATGQTIDRPLDRGMARDLGRRICTLKGIKETPQQYRDRRAAQAKRRTKGNA